jgi:glycosyltransferase involved in cell wall biosynthesis
VRTVVRDGETGVLVPPGQAEPLAGALARVLGDASERERLGASARARVERELTWDHALERLVATYATLRG